MVVKPTLLGAAVGLQKAILLEGSARSHANVLKSSDGIGLRLVWEPL